MIPMQRGVGLVELMIAMLIGLVLVAGLIGQLLQVRAHLGQTDRLASLVAGGSLGLAIISQDASLAGFWGRSFDPADIRLPAGLYSRADDSARLKGADCGPTRVEPDTGAAKAYAFDLIRPIEHTDASVGPARHDCLRDVEPGSDILTIRRVYGSSTPVDRLKAGRVYLYSAARSAEPDRLLIGPDAGAGDATGGSYWRYFPTIYFIRKHARHSGDGIPTLCRKELVSGPAWRSECLVEGVETLQLEFGIDTNRDGAPNRYTDQPTTSELALVSTVRIHLLLRSLSPQPGPPRQQRFQLGRQHIDTNDRYQRKLVSTTVVLPNPVRLRSQS